MAVLIAIVSLLLARPSLAAEEFQWQPDLATAQHLARQSQRLVLIHFGGPWCMPCQRLEQQVFSQPGFGKELVPNFVAVKVDPKKHPAVANSYGVRPVPCDVITTATGQLVYKVSGPFRSAEDYVTAMNRIAAAVRSPTELASAASAQPQQQTATTAQDAAPARQPMSETASSSLAAQQSNNRYATYRQRDDMAARSAPGSRPNDAELSIGATHSASPNRSLSPSVPASAQISAAAGYTANQGEPSRETPASFAQSQGNAAAGGMADNRRAPAGQTNPASSNQPANSNPPLGLDGYCPVTLIRDRRWQPGDERWGAIHRGRTYLFASENDQKIFLENPDHFSPALSGNDPVIAIDHRRAIPGKREFGAFFNDRIYLFSSEETFRQFDREPSRYTVDARQAIRR